MVRDLTGGATLGTAVTAWAAVLVVGVPAGGVGAAGVGGDAADTTAAVRPPPADGDGTETVALLSPTAGRAAGAVGAGSDTGAADFLASEEKRRTTLVAGQGSDT